MTRPSGPAERELHAETTINASPEHVWTLLTDFSQMPDWSPELVKMVALKPGGLRVGQWYLGINKRKAAVWPTRSVVAILEPGRTVAWDTKSSGARWIWEIAAADAGTHVVHRRPVPNRLSVMGRLYAPLALGGTESHADELEVGMRETLSRLKAAAEAS